MKTALLDAQFFITSFCNKALNEVIRINHVYTSIPFWQEQICFDSTENILFYALAGETIMW
jgi:hypothetical protein